MYKFSFNLIIEITDLIETYLIKRVAEHMLEFSGWWRSETLFQEMKILLIALL